VDSKAVDVHSQVARDGVLMLAKGFKTTPLGMNETVVVNAEELSQELRDKVSKCIKGETAMAFDRILNAPPSPWTKRPGELECVKNCGVNSRIA